MAIDRVATVIAAHHWFDDVVGGSFRLATEFAEYLAASGLNVIYVCCGRPDQSVSLKCTRERGVEVRRYAPPTRGGRLSRLRHHVRRTSELIAQAASEFQIELINGHSPLQHFGAAKAIGCSGSQYHYTVHSPFDEELLANGPPNRPRLALRLTAVAARWLEKRNVESSTCVQTDSAFTLKRLREKFPSQMKSKGVVAPGWVDCDRFRPSLDRQSVRNRLGHLWQTTKPLFLTVRRLEPRMGLDTLIEAASIGRARGLDFRVLIGGSGSQRDSIAQDIRDRGVGEAVHLIGRIPEELLADAYAAADCFVLPTRALECFGLIVLEAWAAGAPVIASDVAAIPELVDQQGGEWLFSPGDATSLANRLEAFIDGRLTLSRDVRALAERYDRKLVLSRWKSLAYPNIKSP